jgi:serine/threonine-protein kinase HipA
MKRAEILVNNIPAGILTEISEEEYRFQYYKHYSGDPVSLTIPVRDEPYEYSKFPPFFEGLLPEGAMLEALLRNLKIDRKDNFAQLCAVGDDMIGTVTAREIK